MEGPHQASFDAPLPLLCISQRRRPTSAGHSNHSWCPCARVERGRSSAHPTERNRGCSPSCRKRSSHRTTSLCEMPASWWRVKAGPLVGLQGILVRKKSLYRLVLSVEMLGKSAAVEVDALLVEKLDGKLLNHSTSSCQPCFGTLTTSSDVRLTPLRSVECINGVRHEHRKRIRLRRGGENKGG